MDEMVPIDGSSTSSSGMSRRLCSLSALPSNLVHPPAEAMGATASPSTPAARILPTTRAGAP